ncbi:MAG TPA: SAM-dependent methyltransferase [Streptosporangiaceae bacterium]|nr:SAM-dependent methyltransferase [Streptosporangiaceae bacterium]
MTGEHPADRFIRSSEAGAREEPPIPPGVDPQVPSPARLYDYYLGGKINFPADRDAAERIRRDLPEISDLAWANRGFHQRAVRWLAAEQGIRQFIDIGSGLPTVGNTHEVAQKVTPDVRVAYVDSDPMVRAYAGQLLTDSRRTAFVFADLRDPDSLLGDRQLRALIDFTEPIGLMMTAVLHFVADSSDPWGLVARYVAALPPGSYLALSHATADKLPQRGVQAGLAVYAKATENIYLRPKPEVERFFAGLELVPPWPDGAPRLVFMGEWAAEDPELADSDGSRWGYCGVALRR